MIGVFTERTPPQLHVIFGKFIQFAKIQNKSERLMKVVCMHVHVRVYVREKEHLKKKKQLNKRHS